MNSYSALVEAIGGWLDRDDLAARSQDFIRLTEARLNRLLSDPEMAVSTTLAATSDYTDLPVDFGEMVSINTGTGPLSASGPVEFAGLRSVPGEPRYYSIVARRISFAPANSSAVINLVYRRTIPSLTASAPVNWLLTRAPDVYLYGALVQASAFLVEDDRVGMWKSAFDEAINELRIDGERRKWGAGPIAPRIGRP